MHESYVHGIGGLLCMYVLFKLDVRLFVAFFTGKWRLYNVCLFGHTVGETNNDAASRRNPT